MNPSFIIICYCVSNNLRISVFYWCIYYISDKIMAFINNLLTIVCYIVVRLIFEQDKTAGIVRVTVMYELSTEVTENIIKQKGNLVANYYSGIIHWIECKFYEIRCNLVKLDAIWWIICLNSSHCLGLGSLQTIRLMC